MQKSIQLTPPAGSFLRLAKKPEINQALREAEVRILWQLSIHQGYRDRKEKARTYQKLLDEYGDTREVKRLADVIEGYLTDVRQSKGASINPAVGSVESQRSKESEAAWLLQLAQRHELRDRRVSAKTYRRVLDEYGNTQWIKSKVVDIEKKVAELNAMASESTPPSEIVAEGSHIDAPDVAALIDQFMYGDYVAAAAAADVLGYLVPDVKAALPALIQGLKDERHRRRRMAARALMNVGPEAKAAVEALIELIKNGDGWDRVDAVHALGRIDPEAKAAIPALILVLKDDHGSLRSSAVSRLARMGPEAKAAVPALILTLNDKVVSIRRGAAFALGRIGPDARAAVPALIQASKDEDPQVHHSAFAALRNIDPKSKADVPALILALKNGHPHVRRWAVVTLGKIGPDASAAVPALTGLLEDEQLRVYVQGALRKIQKND